MNTQHKMSRDRTTEIKTPIGTGKMGNTQLSSIYQNHRVLLERNCGSSDPTGSVRSAHLAAVALAPGRISFVHCLPLPHLKQTRVRTLSWSHDPFHTPLLADVDL